MVARLSNGRVLVAGGAGDSNLVANSGYATYTSDAADLYDPVANSWLSMPPLPEPRAGGASVALTDGSVLLIGGYASSPPDGEQTDLASAVRFVPNP
jgi:N-acetylneuraminic acid mutarotase